MAHSLINSYTLCRSAACVQRSSETVSTLHQCSPELDLSRVHSQYERERENPCMGETHAQMFVIPQLLKSPE